VIGRRTPVCGGGVACVEAGGGGAPGGGAALTKFGEQVVDT
jgi:molybdenum-dependent DNA-binding transcriptional regulator ModE